MNLEKPPEERFKISSGAAELEFTRDISGNYRLAFGVAEKTVFEQASLTGGEFGLIIKEVAAERTAANRLRLTGHTLRGDNWQGIAEALVDKPGWFRLYATFQLSGKLELKQAGAAPILSLTLTSLRQPEQVVTVNQPTEHNPPVPWLRSNDLPAAYLWDEVSETETIVFPNLEECDWFQREGLNRLADYRCGLDESGQKFGFMLRPDSATQPATVPVGTYHLACHIHLNHRAERPTPWQAVRALIAGCAEILPGQPAILPPPGVSWMEFARRGLHELMQPGLCWMEDAVRGYVAYVQEASQLARNGGPVDERIEAMASLDVLPPWFAALRLWPSAEQEAHLLAVASSLRHHYSPEHNLFINQVDLHSSEALVRHPQTQVGTAYGDSWYFFEPLLRLGWCAHLFPAPEFASQLCRIFLAASERAIEFIQKHQYRPAAFYDPLTLLPFAVEIPAEAAEMEADPRLGSVPAESRPWLNWLNTSQNWACLGLYACIMLQAYYFSGEKRFREEAQKALAALRRFPPDAFFWEPFEISYAAAAAALMGENELATDLAANLLRMGYWQDETGLPGPPRPRRGLFQAWAGIRYPAQKENGETLLALLPWLRRTTTENDRPIVEAVLKFFNLARFSAFSHYSPCLDERELYPGRLPTPAPHIPLEDLEMFEWCKPMHLSAHQTVPAPGQASGAIGREIYGAGETVWFALMFEALGSASNPAVLVLNLDLFEWDVMNIFPCQPERSFIVYNPDSAGCTFDLTFTALQPARAYRLRGNNQDNPVYTDENGVCRFYQFSLGGNEWQRLTLVEQGEIN